jgi:drug/metabolite transporter (DMT)-like permease
MIAGAILFGLVSMVSYGLANAFSQPLAKRLGAVRFLLVRGLVTFAIVFALSIPTLGNLADWKAALAALAIGLFGYLPPLAYTQGIKVSRVSVVTPIAATAPFITVLLAALFMHTDLQAIQWLGIAVIIAANIAASVDFRSLRNSKLLNLASGVPYGLAAAVGWGLVFFLIMYPNDSLGPWVTAMMLEVGVVIGSGLHLLARRQPFKVREGMSKAMVGNALLIALGTLGFTLGVTYFNVGLVAALSNSMAVVSIVAATIIHGERLTRTEKILATLMAGGVILISIA